MKRWGLFFLMLSIVLFASSVKISFTGAVISDDVKIFNYPIFFSAFVSFILSVAAFMSKKDRKQKKKNPGFLKRLFRKLVK